MSKWQLDAFPGGGKTTTQLKPHIHTYLKITFHVHLPHFLGGCKIPGNHKSQPPPPRLVGWDDSCYDPPPRMTGPRNSPKASDF